MEDRMTIQLHHGDCLEVMPTLVDGSVDMVLVDLPYGTTQNRWDSIIPLEPMWEQVKRIVKPNGAIVMTAAQPFTTTLIASNMSMFKYEMCWAKTRKTGHLNAKKRPMVAHENIVVFYSDQPTYCPVKFMKSVGSNEARVSETGTPNYGKIVNGENYKRPEYKSKDSVISGFPVDSRGLHPTQKPVALMEYMIKTYTLEGETVLDFTMGSGTTGVACRNLNRNFIGIEKDQSYFDIASERINTAQLQLLETA